MIYLISGNGRGAGKTTLARKLAADGCIFSHAHELRVQLKAEYPGLPWFSTDQFAKDTPRHELGGKSMRDLLVSWGQDACLRNTVDYWARILAGKIEAQYGEIYYPPHHNVAVDDLRKTVELELIRDKLSRYGILHLHIKAWSAIPEPEYDGPELEGLADYVIIRR